MPTDQPHRPWFGPKRIGFGYGPETWQGWALMALFAALVVLVVLVWS